MALRSEAHCWWQTPFFNPSSRETEANGSLMNLRPAWFTEFQTTQKDPENQTTKKNKALGLARLPSSAIITQQEQGRALGLDLSLS